MRGVVSKPSATVEHLWDCWSSPSGGWKESRAWEAGQSRRLGFRAEDEQRAHLPGLQEGEWPDSLLNRIK